MDLTMTVRMEQNAVFYSIMPTVNLPNKVVIVPATLFGLKQTLLSPAATFW